MTITLIFSANARRALLKAETRKTIKGALFVTTLTDMPRGIREQLGAVDKLMKIPEFRIQMGISKEKPKNGEEEKEAEEIKQ